MVDHKRRTLRERLYAPGRTIRQLNGCLIWQGSTSLHGYGQIADENRRLVGTHRAAWTIENGVIPKGVHVCHRCDVRLCVEVTHLFLGTRSDNMRDMVRKGRDRPKRGIDHPHARLTDEQVWTIRTRYIKGIHPARKTGGSRAELAAEFGVCKQYINDLVKRRWRATA